YNDSQGVTAAFNLNLLARLNREYEGDFRPDRFRHVAHYDTVRREARAYLQSTADQAACLNRLGLCINLAVGEKIQTEISRKYTLDDIERLAGVNGFTVLKHFFDRANYFCCSLWVRA